MTDSPKTTPNKGAKSEREERLNAALRANLQKRKQQTRVRTQPGAPGDADGDADDAPASAADMADTDEG